MSKKITDKINYALTRECTKQEQVVLNYLLENVDKIESLTARMVANECFCSTSAVNRAIKKLGLEGFVELKKFEKFNNDLEMQAMEPKSRFREFINIIIDDIDYKQVQQMVNVICRAEKIYVYGNGVSNVSSLFLFRQLLNLGYSVIHIPDMDLLYRVQKGIIIIMSNTGENNLVHNVINTKVSVPVYAITKKDSTLDKLSTASITHDMDLNNVTELAREQQIQILLLIDVLIDELYQLKTV